jgi:hypothetical protein
LQIVTVCPRQDTNEIVYDTLRGIIQSNRERGQPIPAFRLSAALFYQDFWDENEVFVESFDPTDAVGNYVYSRAAYFTKL